MVKNAYCVMCRVAHKLNMIQQPNQAIVKNYCFCQCPEYLHSAPVDFGFDPSLSVYLTLVSILTNCSCMRYRQTWTGLCMDGKCQPVSSSIMFASEPSCVDQDILLTFYEFHQLPRLLRLLSSNCFAVCMHLNFLMIQDQPGLN